MQITVNWLKEFVDFLWDWPELVERLTVVGLELGSLLGGTVIVEIVFSWPGVGRLLIDGIGNRDFTVVQAAVTAITAIFVVMNLLVDLLYTRIDPRIRLDAGERV